VLIVFLAASYLLYGDKAAQGPNQVALGFCALIAAGIAAKNGIPWSGLRQAGRWRRGRSVGDLHPACGRRV
jgi:Na+:H+ antiporter, NhaC family